MTSTTRLLWYLLALGSEVGITTKEAIRRWGGGARRYTRYRAAIRAAGVEVYRFRGAGPWYANVEDALVMPGRWQGEAD